MNRWGWIDGVFAVLALFLDAGLLILLALGAASYQQASPQPQTKSFALVFGLGATALVISSVVMLFNKRWSFLLNSVGNAVGIVPVTIVNLISPGNHLAGWLVDAVLALFLIYSLGRVTSKLGPSLV